MWRVFENNEKRRILYEEGSDRRLAEMHVEEFHHQILLEILEQENDIWDN